jgi:hypothetical protein
MTDPFVTFRWLDAEGNEIGTVRFTADEWDLAWARWCRLPQDVRDAVLDGRVRIERVPIDELADLAAD